MGIINNVKGLLNEGDKLLYLTEFGSFLYGTNTENSDHDYKGIYLPCIDNFYCHENPKAITVSSGDPNSKNDKDDVDIQLYSLQYFIHKLLSNGDTSALDLLFSVNNKDAVLYGYNNMIKIKDNIHKILNIKDANAYIGYAISQARKYGIKGSRLGVLKQIKEWLHNKSNIGNSYEYAENTKLESIADKILKEFYHESYCFHKQGSNKDKNVDYLVVCGSLHQYNISLNEFYDRICRAMESYGGRTKKAESDGGIDYKALSHAIRVLYQCKELYETGNITFPLKESDREDVLLVKNGSVSYEHIENVILTLLEEVDIMRNKCNLDWKYNKKYCIQLVREFYE